MRADGSAVLTDFGIARAIAGESTFTQEGTSVGTPHYMSPEQLRGDSVDGRSDLYSLGVTMYQLLTGELPYRGTDGWAIGMQHLTAALPRLPETLARLQPLLDSLMAKDPAHRPQSGAEVVARIDRLQTGTQSTPTVGLDHSGLGLSRLRSGQWPMALGLALMAGVLAWQTWRADSAATGATGAASTAVVPSIAVLPFADLSPGRDQAYFSDGLAEELLTRLTRVSGLRVIARTSSFAFRGREADLTTIGKALNVASVLEGSVRRSGDRVRITAKLVRISDSSHLWSETYDRQLNDVFAVQEEIAAAVVDALRVELLPRSAGESPDPHTPSPEAYDQFLMGRQWFNRGSAEGMAMALTAYRKAVSLDPNYAAAYAGLAVVEYAASDGYNFVDNDTLRAAGRQRAMDAAERAVALAPTLADGYSVRGFIRMLAGWDWAGARADLDRAVALNPNDAFNLVRRARLHAAMGELPEALATIRRAIEADPLSPPAWNFLGRFEAANGDLIAARQAQMRVLAITPEHGRAPVDLGLLDLLEGKALEARARYAEVRDEPLRLLGIAASEHSLGNAEPALQALDELKLKYANGAAYQIAEVHAWRGERDQAFEWMERAIVQGDGGLQYLKYDPMLEGLVADPRYGQVLERLGLPVEP
jgi:TolB-like protein/Tfp pilus assembly protein PilF